MKTLRLGLLLAPALIMSSLAMEEELAEKNKVVGSSKVQTSKLDTIKADLAAIDLTSLTMDQLAQLQDVLATKLEKLSEQILVQLTDDKFDAQVKLFDNLVALIEEPYTTVETMTTDGALAEKDQMSKLKELIAGKKAELHTAMDKAEGFFMALTRLEEETYGRYMYTKHQLNLNNMDHVSQMAFVEKVENALHLFKDAAAVRALILAGDDKDKRQAAVERYRAELSEVRPSGKAFIEEEHSTLYHLFAALLNAYQSHTMHIFGIKEAEVMVTM